MPLYFFSKGFFLEKKSKIFFFHISIKKEYFRKIFLDEFFLIKNDVNRRKKIS